MQKEVSMLLNQLQSVGNHLWGTSRYKQARRHELRGLIRKFETPALFVTINPADVYNPLVGVFGGKEVSEWRAMSQLECTIFVVRHPAPAAQFFDEIMQAFISTIVHPGSEHPGLFGICDAFYGMVEAQGRGTLHCHMLLWIHGHPNPQLLRERMQADVSYHQAVITWLELTIKCELPGQTEVSPLPVRAPVVEGIDLRLAETPQLVHLTKDEFETAYSTFVSNLVTTCNWHEHTNTCWKNLKPGQPHNDAHCWMRIDATFN